MMMMIKNAMHNKQTYMWYFVTVHFFELLFLITKK